MYSSRERRGWSCGARPDLGALLDLCEANYKLLITLAPDVRTFEENRISGGAGAPDLYLFALERSPWTTVIRMTYFFEGEGDYTAEPDFHIRLSHDARLAEVLSWHTGGERVLVSGGTWCCSGLPGVSTLGWRWRANLLLEKWLRFCLERGHGFVPGAAPVCVV